MADPDGIHRDQLEAHACLAWTSSDPWWGRLPAECGAQLLGSGKFLERVPGDPGDHRRILDDRVFIDFWDPAGEGVIPLCPPFQRGITSKSSLSKVFQFSVCCSPPRRCRSAVGSRPTSWKRFKKLEQVSEMFITDITTIFDS